jgi:hypothetical protein
MADFSTLNGYGVKDAQARANIGTLSELTTDEKTTLAGAVNEVDSHADANASSIGTLSDLETSHKDNLVEAINEVRSSAGGSDWASVAGLSGRNLLDVLNVSSVSAAAQALKAKSDAKDYSGLRLGDYLEITATYGEYGSITAKYEIAAMGQYHWFYNGSSVEWDLGSITFLASRILFTRQIGTSTSQRMYFTSPMNTFLSSTVATALEAVLGVTLKRAVLYQQYNDNTYADPTWCTDPNDWDVDDNEALASPKVFLPSQRELSGEAGFSAPYLDNSRQFPLLANVPEKIPAKNLAGSFTWEWTRSPSVDPGYFCALNTNGYANSYGAGNSVGGVRPAFNL